MCQCVTERPSPLPELYAGHVRWETVADWRYWVFSSLLGHTVHSFAQQVQTAM